MSGTAFEARYAYIRVTFKGDIGVTPVEIVVGVELKTPVRDIRTLYHLVREYLQPAADFLLASDADDVSIAHTMEQCIRSRWPGRTYFIEVGRGDMDEYVQVFEPLMRGHNS